MERMLNFICDPNETRRHSISKETLTKLVQGYYFFNKYRSIRYLMAGEEDSFTREDRHEIDPFFHERSEYRNLLEKDLKKLLVGVPVINSNSREETMGDLFAWDERAIEDELPDFI